MLDATIIRYMYCSNSTTTIVKIQDIKRQDRSTGSRDFLWTLCYQRYS